MLSTQYIDRWSSVAMLWTYWQKWTILFQLDSDSSCHHGQPTKSGFKMQQHHYSHKHLIKYPSLYTSTCVPRISSMFWPVAVLIDNGIGARITMVEAMFVMSDTCLINSINSYVTWRQIGHHSPWKCFAPCRFHATFRRSNGQQGGYKYYATKLHRILS